MDKTTQTAEVLMHTLARAFGVSMDEDMVDALVDAFADAVEARVEERERLANRSLDT